MNHNELINDNLWNIKNSTEKIQIIILKYNPNLIKHIKNPTERVQLEAVKLHPSIIKFIKNPTDKVKLICL